MTLFLIYLSYRIGLTLLLLFWGYRLFVEPKRSLSLLAALGAVCTVICPELVGIIACLNWLADNGDKIVIWKRREPVAKEENR